MSVDDETNMLTINDGEKAIVIHELLKFLNKKIRITIEEVEE